MQSVTTIMVRVEVDRSRKAVVMAATTARRKSLLRPLTMAQASLISLQLDHLLSVA